MSWRSTMGASAAATQIERALDTSRLRIEAWGDSTEAGADLDAMARAIDALAGCTADLATRLPAEVGSVLAKANAQALGELARSPRGDFGALVAAHAVLERALREVLRRIRSGASTEVRS